MNALVAPCAKCPFRKDCTPGWLGKQRMQQICDDTVTGDNSFICHETTHLKKVDHKFCAGKLILEGRVNPRGNMLTRLGIRWGFIPDYSELKNQSIVFDTVQDAVDHHTYRKTKLP